MRTLARLAAVVVFAHAGPSLHAADGDLDPDFGSTGKVMLSAASEGLGASSLTATDVAVQPGGKIIVAGSDDHQNCFIARLNVDGSLDTGFGGSNGFSPGFAGYGGCAYTGVAVRPDGRIVGAFTDPTGALGGITQFTANGAPDLSFGQNAAAFLHPNAASDGAYAQRLVIDTDGSIAIAGFYHQQSSNDNQFLFDRISADGNTIEPLFLYSFGSGQNQDDHALDLAIDDHGRYVVGGYHRGPNGNYDCAAIRIRHDLFDVDNSFGTAGQTTVAFDKGGDNGDFCNAIAVVPQSEYVVLGGHATASTGSDTYQAAVLAFLDGNGNLVEYGCVAVCQYAKFAFAYNHSSSAGATNAITRLIIDNHDAQNPRVLAVGSGNQSGVPYGVMFGIARVNLPLNNNFNLDPAFGNNGTEGIWFAERPDGIGLLRTTNTGLSGVVDQGGELVTVGTTLAIGGNSAAVSRTVAFDGIFKNGWEKPYYNP